MFFRMSKCCYRWQPYFFGLSKNLRRLRCCRSALAAPPVWEQKPPAKTNTSGGSWDMCFLFLSPSISKMIHLLPKTLRITNKIQVLTKNLQVESIMTQIKNGHAKNFIQQIPNFLFQLPNCTGVAPDGAAKAAATAGGRSTPWPAWPWRPRFFGKGNERPSFPFNPIRVYQNQNSPS